MGKDQGRDRGHITDPFLAFRAVAEASGVQVSSHDLRRTFISVAKRIGIDPIDRKAVLNHALGNGDVTDGYVQIEAEDLRQPAQLVCDRLVELCGIVTPAGNVTLLA